MWQDDPNEAPTATSIEELTRAVPRQELPAVAGEWTVENWTIPSSLVAHAAVRPGAPAFVFRTGEDWTTWTWADTAHIAAAMGRMFLSLFGVRAGDAIGLDAPNGPAWLALDLGAQMIGAFTIPIYADSPEGSARAAFESMQSLDEVPKVFFSHRPDVFDDLVNAAPDGTRLELATLGHLRELIGQADGVEAFQYPLPELPQSDIACGVYVRPDVTENNGARILAVSQRHVGAQCAALGSAFAYKIPVDAGPDPGSVDRRLSVLPWAHIVERIQSVYLSIAAGTPTYVPCTPRDLLLDLQDAGPTLLCASSQLYDHLRQRLVDVMQALVGDAIDLARVFADLETESAMRLVGDDIPPDLEEQAEEWRYAIEPLAEGLLGGHLRMMTSASRQFDVDTDLFYEAVGQRIYRSFGGNRLGGVIATNSPTSWRVDTFGQELSPYSLSAGNDHRLTVQDPLVWPLSEGKPDGDFVGAIPTADVAEISDGWLQVFGADEAVTPERVSSRGINLTPTEEESQLMSDPLVDQAVAVEGAMRIVPDHDALADWTRRWGVGDVETEEERRKIQRRFEVLTGMKVDLQQSRENLGQDVAAEMWSHVDEMDLAVSTLQRTLEEGVDLMVQPDPQRLTIQPESADQTVRRPSLRIEQALDALRQVNEGETKKRKRSKKSSKSTKAAKRQRRMPGPS